MRSDNLQFSYVQPSASSYHFQIPHGRHGHGGRGGHCGKDGTGRDKLTFKLDFPGNLCGAAFAIHAMFS